MESQEIKHFVHTPGSKPKVAVAAAEDTLREVLIRLEVKASSTRRPQRARTEVRT
jgi:hypothetical protein